MCLKRFGPLASDSHRMRALHLCQLNLKKSVPFSHYLILDCDLEWVDVEFFIALMHAGLALCIQIQSLLKSKQMLLLIEIGKFQNSYPLGTPEMQTMFLEIY